MSGSLLRESSPEHRRIRGIYNPEYAGELAKRVAA
jgi:hypothetical protein